MIKEGKYAVFEYEEQDGDLIDGLVAHIDSKAEEIYIFFDLKPSNEKVHYKIFPTKKDFDSFYKQIRNLDANCDLPNWLVGCVPEKNKIFMVSFHDYKNIESHKNDKSTSYKKTALHEFVHTVNNKFNEKHAGSVTAKFFREGIACYLSGQYEGAKLKFDGSLVKFDGSLDNLLSGKDEKYYNYYLLAKYLVENYDKNFVLFLFKNRNKAIAFLKEELFDKVNEYFGSPV